MPCVSVSHSLSFYLNSPSHPPFRDASSSPASRNTCDTRLRWRCGAVGQTAHLRVFEPSQYRSGRRRALFWHTTRRNLFNEVHRSMFRRPRARSCCQRPRLAPFPADARVCSFPIRGRTCAGPRCTYPLYRYRATHHPIRNPLQYCAASIRVLAARGVVSSYCYIHVLYISV